jgi:hypothetical protein
MPERTARLRRFQTFPTSTLGGDQSDPISPDGRRRRPWGGRKAVPGVRTSRAGTSRARNAKQQLTAWTNDGIVAAAETEAAGRTDPLGRQRDSEPQGKAAAEGRELLLEEEAGSHGSG